MSELMGAILDPASMLNRALDFARNLTLESMLLRLGLDPNHLTSDAVFHRLMEIALAHITLANMLALTGAALYVATLMVRTIVPLRVIGIISILFFIGYGVTAGAVTDTPAVSAFAADQRRSFAADAELDQKGPHLCTG